MTRDHVILPGATIGILGGGQLGRMIALKAKEMGYRIASMDAYSDSPCGQVADTELIAPLDDLSTARELARISDVVTYEFENVSSEMLEILENEAYLPQGAELLKITRNRIHEKQALEKIGAPVAPWLPVGSLEELQVAVEQLGIPCVLKTATGGYDGKGQYVLRDTNDINVAWNTLKGNCNNMDKEFDATDHSAVHKTAEFVLESWVPFDMELSVIAARSPSGEIRTFPTAENIHWENILHQSIVPARVSKDVEQEAQRLAQSIAEKLNMVGTLAVEMFCKQDQLIVNELAPRPHNSGHYTMDACCTSQFEQHVRAICNLPLGNTDLVSPVVMVNILGQHVQPVLENINRLGDGFKLHLYGKDEAKYKRKMGHLNVTGVSIEDALEKIEQLGIWQHADFAKHITVSYQESEALV